MKSFQRHILMKTWIFQVLKQKEQTLKYNLVNLLLDTYDYSDYFEKEKSSDEASKSDTAPKGDDHTPTMPLLKDDEEVIQIEKD